jgi:hypothetical protein
MAKVRSIPETAHKILEQDIPREFDDNGCSNAPDEISGYNFRWACRIHDWRYCTRCHPAGSMTVQAKDWADRELKINLQAYLPFFLRCVGWVYRFMTWKYGGYSAFDSCGPTPEGLSLNPCRHGMYPPKWMLEQAALRGDFDK